MDIAIYGTGGVGGYYGARLAQAGHRVSFIARGQQLDAIRQSGLRLESILGDFHLADAVASDTPADIGPVDAVLVCVKSWQVPEVARAMAPLVGADTVVLSLLNGVEAPGQLATELGEAAVIGGVAKIFSYIGRPGVICHIGHQPTIALGELDGRPSARCDRLADALCEAGITVERPADIVQAMWKKFLFISGWGGLGAISRAPVGILRSEPDTRRLIDACLQEGQAVARARGIDLPADIIQRTWQFIDSLEPAGTSSLQRDIAAGRPSELEAWNGAVVRFGRQHGVATPTHELITSALRPLERRARGTLEFDTT